MSYSDYLRQWKVFTDDDLSVPHATALLEDWLPGQPDTLRLADLCCGTGHFGRAIAGYLETANRGVVSWFVDESREVTRGLAGGTVVCADIGHMPEFAPGGGYFDLVTCRYGFNNLPRESWMPALEEALRILKPGGMFLLQDHFVPGATFSALVNEAEAMIARLDGKARVPFIFSTEGFNSILDEHPLVESRVKTGYPLIVDVWERLRAKFADESEFESARAQVLRFYRETCLRRFQVKVVHPENYIPVFNVTYGIRKRK